MSLPLRVLFFPLAIMYGIIIVLWDLYWRFAPKIKLSSKVISVGNIVAGGTGKTPLVIYIARLAKEAGFKTAVVARGYKRRKKEMTEVGGDDKWETVGDEPLEIFRAAPGVRVYVGESKARAAGKAAADGAEVIIVDDGFQHRGLYRDVDLVCLDASQPFGSGWLLPAGKLREPRYNLRRADALIFTSYDKDNNTIDKVVDYGRRPHFFSVPRLVYFAKLDDNSAASGDTIARFRSIAFCGLANPNKFKMTLNRAGIAPLKFRFFSDHHRYSRFDIEMLMAMARRENADCLITTRKDAVKFDSVAFGDLPVYYTVIDITVSDETEFKKMIGL
jgi:tetraacyldisaccharide 4'-kinase